MHGLGKDFDPFNTVLEVPQELQMTTVSCIAHKVASLQEIIKGFLLQMRVKFFQD